MSGSDSPFGKWIKCISTHGNIRGVAIEATGLVQTMADAHQFKGQVTRGLGEAVMGALLIASHCKAGQRINLNIRGTGRFRQALVDAYPDGHVRGYVIERPDPHMETVTEQEFGPWGSGLLSVLRTKDEEGEKPYIGTVPLLTGHLAKDLSFYWAQSEQVPSAVGLAVNLKGERVASAGAFLIQALPGASPAEIAILEQHIREIGSLTRSVAENPDPMNVLSQIFQSTAFMLVEEKALEFRCNCTRERVERALLLVGSEELKLMLEEDHGASVHCDFCAREYQVDAETLERLLKLV